ncbi:22157_t:CDS:2, partial [Cetraspora pellucida]
RKRKGDDKWEGDMNELAQQIQNMTTNYTKLTALLTTQTEVNKSRPRPPTRANVSVTCYWCGEKGHYARECLTERETPVPHERRPTQPIQVLRHEVEANYGSIDDGYDNEGEKEIFVTGERYYLYSRRNKDRPRILNHNGKKLHQPGGKVEIKDLYDDEDNLFDCLIYEDEEVEETEGYFTEELMSKEDAELYSNPWQDVQSPAAYLSHVEELSTTHVEPKVDDLKEKVEKMCVNEELDAEQQKEAKKLLKREKDIFAQTVDELGCTNHTHHVIDTGDITPIKQNPYRAAPSIKDFIKSEITQLKKRGLIRAVLAQKDDDRKEFMVSYASKGLTPPERNYAATELECLAVLWAVEHFHHYYELNPFVVVTDHSALKWLKTSKLTGRCARWMLHLQPYDFTIQHRSGRKHNNADALSRI